MISTKNFTIIIPCISFKDVKKCIKNIREKYKTIKIIVCLNSLNLKKNRDKNLKLILTKAISIGEKRNIAVNACKSKYLAFIDSDAYPEKNWLESTFKLLKKKKVGIIAGPHVDPLKQNSSEQLIGLIKKSFLITIRPKIQKNNIEKQQYVNFLPSVNWILSKKFFNSLNQMNNKLLRNEDWDFVYRMRKKKFKLLYSPKTLVYHENNTISHFLTKRFKYGFHMWPILMQQNFDNYYYFVPLIFTIFLFSFPLAFLFNYYYYFYLSILIIYILTVFIATLKVCDKLQNFLKILVILCLGSIMPGLGMLSGFLNFFKK